MLKGTYIPFSTRQSGNSYRRFCLYHLPEATVIEWMAEEEIPERMRKAKPRLLAAKAGLRWQEYGKALGVLVEIDEVRPVFEEAMMAFRSRLLDLPGRLDTSWRRRRTPSLPSVSSAMRSATYSIITVKWSFDQRPGPCRSLCHG